ncbi:MAG: glycosyltransferase family 4 protein [Chloroflexi bacterium]|nr:MAG: glycosyltransferase family 4 protein [Chloroflexota bacterium]
MPSAIRCPACRSPGSARFITALTSPSPISWVRARVDTWFSSAGSLQTKTRSPRSRSQSAGDALALLLPVAWDEPFGLTFIESLACGTPVISRPRGSLPELMVSGTHGFLSDDEDDLVEACHRLGEMRPLACRQWASERFSTERMVGDYEKVVRRVAGWEHLVA